MVLKLGTGHYLSDVSSYEHKHSDAKLYDQTNLLQQRRPLISKGGRHMNDPRAPLFLLNQKPDALEIWIRAGCGALLGLLVASCVWIRIYPVSIIWVAMLFLSSIVGCVWGAVHYGDSFWIGAIHAIRTWL